MQQNIQPRQNRPPKQMYMIMSHTRMNLYDYGIKSSHSGPYSSSNVTILANMIHARVKKPAEQNSSFIKVFMHLFGHIK